MRLILRRQPSSFVSTIGELFVDGSEAERRICWTLEDVVREVPGVPVSEWKIPGETAIPAGEYGVSLTWSNRFHRIMPLLRGVRGFSGIRIHAGNTSADTEGCIIVGYERSGDALLKSRLAYGEVLRLIEGAIFNNDPVTMQIVPAV